MPKFRAGYVEIERGDTSGYRWVVTTGYNEGAKKSITIDDLRDLQYVVNRAAEEDRRNE